MKYSFGLSSLTERDSLLDLTALPKEAQSFENCKRKHIFLHNNPQFGGSFDVP